MQGGLKPLAFGQLGPYLWFSVLITAAKSRDVLQSQLCIILLSGFWFSKGPDYSRAHTGGRMLNAMDDLTEQPWWFSGLLLTVKWAVHAVIITAVLVKIFVFGEPVTRPHSEKAVVFWRHQKQADADLAHVRDPVYAACLTLSLPSSRSTFSQPFQEKCISEVVRIGVIIICHLSKLWKNKFSILYDGIFLVRLQGKFDIDHSWEWKG